MDKEEEKALEELTEEVVEEEASENSSLSDETRKEVKDVKAKANEALINKLLKSPITWMIVGVGGFVFFVAILIYVMDFDLFGKGNTKPGYYPSTCNQVYWTWERDEYYEAHKNDKDYEKIMDPSQVDLEYEDANKIKRWDYKEFDFDTYITNVIWTDNIKANIVDNQVVYQTMSIAARSFLISTLLDNCVVLSYNNPQSFTKLDGTEENYQEINNAVKETQGLIIGRNQQIIGAVYDPFSYVFKRSDGDEKEHFYHMMQKNNEEQQRIPATWVDKHKNIPINLVLGTKFLYSLSLYGAKYLEEHEDYDYDIYRLLKYYYGQDIEFYTIDYESSDKKPITGPIVGSNGNGCYTWPIGSIETTIENGVEVALGTPETVMITSGFGGRDTGISGASTNHKGIDIAGGRGRGAVNIIAMAGGTVKEVKNGCVTGDYACGSKWGNHIVIDHGNGISTRYAHMYSINVSVGQTVVKGQVLGKIGNTGNVGGSKGKPTGPNDTRGTHLHFEVMENGTRVNPENYVSKVEPRPTNCGGSNSLPLDPIIGGDNKQITCLALKRAGYGDVQVAGMMANAEGESGFRPNAFNPSGGGIGAYGLFQWRAGRQKNLKALKNYDTLEVQVAFAVSELNTGYRTANVKLINSTTPSDASYNFCVYYEVPGRTTEEAQKNCVVRRTNGVADKHYQYVKNGCK